MEIFILEWFDYKHHRKDFIRAYSSLDLALEITPKPKDKDGQFTIIKTTLDTGGYETLFERVIYSSGEDLGWQSADFDF